VHYPEDGSEYFFQSIGNYYGRGTKSRQRWVGGEGGTFVTLYPENISPLNLHYRGTKSDINDSTSSALVPLALSPTLLSVPPKLIMKLSIMSSKIACIFQ
jgi:hypothetical protein